MLQYHYWSFAAQLPVAQEAQETGLRSNGIKQPMASQPVNPWILGAGNRWELTNLQQVEPPSRSQLESWHVIMLGTDPEYDHWICTEYTTNWCQNVFLQLCERIKTSNYISNVRLWAHTKLAFLAHWWVDMSQHRVKLYVISRKKISVWNNSDDFTIVVSLINTYCESQQL